MNTDSLIHADIQRLRDTTARALPSLAETERELARVPALGTRASAKPVLLLVAALVLALGTSWSSVSALARTLWFRAVVQLTGKDDAQAADDIRRQLAAQGWSARHVSVERRDDQREVELSADSDTGKHVALRRTVAASEEGPIELAPEPIDDSREPGMSDSELRDKILRQLHARGIEHAEVSVSGDDVRVLVKRGRPPEAEE